MTISGNNNNGNDSNVNRSVTNNGEDDVRRLYICMRLLYVAF